MIPTIAVIAAIAEKKKNFSDGSDHMKPLSSDCSDNNRWDIKSSTLAIVVTAIAGEWFPYDRWTFFSVIAAITAIVAIIWKQGLIYRNNHPPFLLNCYLCALQTYRTHSSKLRLLLVLWTLSTKIVSVRQKVHVPYMFAFFEIMANGNNFLMLSCSLSHLSCHLKRCSLSKHFFPWSARNLKQTEDSRGTKSQW